MLIARISILSVICSSFIATTQAMVNQDLKLGNSVVNTSLITRFGVIPATKLNIRPKLYELGLVPLSDFMHTWREKDGTHYRIVDTNDQPLIAGAPVIFADNAGPYYRAGVFRECVGLITVYKKTTKEECSLQKEDTPTPSGKSSWQDVALLYIQTTKQGDTRCIRADEVWVSAAGFDALRFGRKSLL